MGGVFWLFWGSGWDFQKLDHLLTFCARPWNCQHFPGGSGSLRGPGSISGWGRSPGEENGYPLQYSCLENSMDGGGVWQTTVHGVVKSQTCGATSTWLSWNCHGASGYVTWPAGVSQWEYTEAQGLVEVIFIILDLVVHCQSLNSCPTLSAPWTAAHQASLSFTISQSLLKLMSLSQWCHLTISSSAAPFSCPQSFPASVSFPVSQLFASDGQSIEASALVLPMDIQGWFPLGLTGLISLLSKGLWRVFSSTKIQKYHFLSAQPSLWSFVHDWKNRGFEYTELCQQSDVSAFKYAV